MDLYEEPYDPQRPTVCFDLHSAHWGESIPLPARPGRRERFDYEYRRNGTRNLFMLCEPLRGGVAVTERRRMGDFAHQMLAGGRGLHQGGEDSLDNLNTHRPASLYETFDPADPGAWSFTTPPNMGWLIRSVFRPMSQSGPDVTRELAALVRRRNEAHATIAIHLGCTDH